MPRKARVHPKYEHLIDPPQFVKTDHIVVGDYVKIQVPVWNIYQRRYSRGVFYEREGIVEGIGQDGNSRGDWDVVIEVRGGYRE